MLTAMTASQLLLKVGKVDLLSGEVHRNSGTITLSPTELRLLRWLADRPNQMISKEELLVDVWGYHPNIHSRTVYTLSLIHI